MDNMVDDDTLWSKTSRETIPELQRRIYHFMAWLIVSHCNGRLQAEVFVLITHGVWIETLLQMYDPTWPGASTKRIHNADIYYCDCAFTHPMMNDEYNLNLPSPLDIRLFNVQQINS
jgi:hypothetical protein